LVNAIAPPERNGYRLPGIDLHSVTDHKADDSVTPCRRFFLVFGNNPGNLVHNRIHPAHNFVDLRFKRFVIGFAKSFENFLRKFGL
jgi:hypothetical protein